VKIKFSNRKYTGIPVVLTLTLCLFILSSGACNNHVNNIPDHSLTTPHNEIADNLSLLSGHLADASGACKNLEDFKWQGLDNLGYWEIQEAGYCCQDPHLCDKNDKTDIYSNKAIWISILTWLPGKERIAPVRKLIDSSAATLNELKQETVSGNTDKTVPGQAQQDDLILNLDASLKSAIYMAGTIDKTSNFNEITRLLLEADATTQQRYQETFIEQSGKYSELLNTLTKDLEKSAEITADFMAKTAADNSQ
jgi:hypothetical protein